MVMAIATMDILIQTINKNISRIVGDPVCFITNKLLTFA